MIHITQTPWGGKFGFSFFAISSHILVESEELLFPLTSLVAEFGGTLGLFLGFSFMTLWDGLKNLVGIWKHMNCTPGNPRGSTIIA